MENKGITISYKRNTFGQKTDKVNKYEKSWQCISDYNAITFFKICGKN